MPRNPIFNPRILDSYSEVNQDVYFAMRSTGTIKSGQAITLAATQALTSCKFFLRLTNSPTGNAVAKVYAATGTVGTNATGTGSALATSNTFDVSTLTASFALIEFTYTSPYRAIAGDYVIVLEYEGGDGTDYIRLGTDTSSPTHYGNSVFYQSSWDYNASGDAIFYLYGY